MQSLSGDTLFFGLIIAVHTPIFRKWVYHTLLVDPTLHRFFIARYAKGPSMPSRRAEQVVLLHFVGGGSLRKW